MAVMTKAQLVDENMRLRAACDLLEDKVATLKRELEAVRADAAMVNNVHPVRVERHANYWDYVKAARKACHSAGREVRYMSREQWEARA